MNKASRPHDETMVELLREDPAFLDEYLAAAMDEAGEIGGPQVLSAVLRQVAEAQGMAAVAKRAGMAQKSLYSALSPNSNPTVKMLLAILAIAGLKLDVRRARAD